MSDIDDIRQANELRAMVNTSPGFKHLEREIEDRIKQGWEKFIDMPVDKKTSKVAYQHQAEYKVLKDLKEWIFDTIRSGDNAEKSQRFGHNPVGAGR